MASRKQVTVAAPKAVTGWADRVKAAAAKQVKAAENIGGGSQWISLKGGLITVNGATSPNGIFQAVVLGYMQERAYYEGEFDGNSPQSPNCYGYGDEFGAEPVAPHQDAVDKQNDTCRGCPHSVYGSAERGRGQACRQSVRMALVPATADGVEGPVFFMRVPPTSIKHVKGWLKAMGEETPCFAVVTEIKVQPSASNMFDVLLTPKQVLPSDFQAAVLAKLDIAEEELRAPYPELEEKAPAPVAVPKKRASGRAKI